MQRKNRVFHIRVDALPEGVDMDDFADYLSDAVGTWQGSLFPGTVEANLQDADPLYDWNAKFEISYRDNGKRNITK